MSYSVILVNNTKWVSSQIFRCGRAKSAQLERGHLHHLAFITDLLLVWPVDHMDPHITDWVTKPIEVTWTVATYQLECDALTYRAIYKTLYCVWQSDRAMGRDFWRNC